MGPGDAFLKGTYNQSLSGNTDTTACSYMFRQEIQYIGKDSLQFAVLEDRKALDLFLKRVEAKYSSKLLEFLRVNFFL